MIDCTIAFRDVLQTAYGALDWLPIPDSSIHRFHVPGDKPGTRNGWYILTAERRPAGCFGSRHRSGIFTAGTGSLFREA